MTEVCRQPLHIRHYSHWLCMLNVLLIQAQCLRFVATDHPDIRRASTTFLNGNPLWILLWVQMSNFETSLHECAECWNALSYGSYFISVIMRWVERIRNFVIRPTRSNHKNVNDSYSYTVCPKVDAQIKTILLRDLETSWICVNFHCISIYRVSQSYWTL